MSIDRLDNDLGYEKSNCRWASVAQQSRHRRGTKLNDVKVSEIRSRYAAGALQRELAADYGV